MVNNSNWKSTICTVLEHLRSNDANDIPNPEFIRIFKGMKSISHSNLVNEHIDEVIVAIADDSYSDKLLLDLIEYVRDYD
jgi:hypothetical protein